MRGGPADQLLVQTSFTRWRYDSFWRCDVIEPGAIPLAVSVGYRNGTSVELDRSMRVTGCLTQEYPWLAMHC